MVDGRVAGFSSTLHEHGQRLVRLTICTSVLAAEGCYEVEDERWSHVDTTRCG